MSVFETVGEIIVRIVFESMLYSIPSKVYGFFTGKRLRRDDDYTTQQKKFINFDKAKKILFTQEKDISNLRNKLTKGLELLNEDKTLNHFKFINNGQHIIIQPPDSISFYSFHFLIQCLTDLKTETIGVVETTRTNYTAYNDPSTINLIGQTDKGAKFFISLMEDYSKRQFLRINNSIETIDAFNVQSIKSKIKANR